LAAPGKFLSARSFELAPPRLGPGMPSAVLRSRSQPLLDLDLAPVVVADDRCFAAGLYNDCTVLK
jgi:hypothetical protein